MERASFKYSRAITDIEVILKEKGYKLDKDIILHLGMELLKAEQHREKAEMLEEKLSSIIDILNYPLYPLTDKLSSSISEIASAISESNYSPIQECPKCFAPISSKYDVCPDCGFTMNGVDSND